MKKKSNHEEFLETNDEMESNNDFMGGMPTKKQQREMNQTEGHFEAFTRWDEECVKRFEFKRSIFKKVLQILLRRTERSKIGIMLEIDIKRDITV